MIVHNVSITITSIDAVDNILLVVAI